MNLSTSGILSRMFAMTKGRLGPLIGLWFVYFAAQIAFMVVFTLVAGVGAFAGAGMEDPAAMAGLGAGLIGMMIVFYLIYLLIYVASYGSLSHMASQLVQPTFGQSIDAGMRSSLSLFATMVLLLIVYFVASLILGAIIGAAGLESSGAGIAALILFVPLLIYLGCRLAILFPLAAVEGIRNPITIIRRSWTMTRGNVLGILGAMLVYLVITIALIAVAFVPMFGTMTGGAGAEPGFGMIIVMLILFLIAAIIVTILGAALASAIHSGLYESTQGNLSETFE